MRVLAEGQGAAGGKKQHVFFSCIFVHTTHVMCMFPFFFLCLVDDVQMYFLTTKGRKNTRHYSVSPHSSNTDPAGHSPDGSLTVKAKSFPYVR